MSQVAPGSLYRRITVAPVVARRLPGSRGIVQRPLQIQADSSDEASSPPEKGYDRLYQGCEHADIWLVSREGSKFHARLKNLEVHADLFDAMSELDIENNEEGDKTLSLSDVGERGLDLLLALMHGGILPPKADRDPSVFKDAYTLAMKWGCRLLVDMLRTAIIAEPAWPDETFFDLGLAHLDWGIIHFAAPAVARSKDIVKQAVRALPADLHDLRSKYGGDGALALVAAAGHIPGKIDEKMALAVAALFNAITDMMLAHAGHGNSPSCGAAAHALKRFSDFLLEVSSEATSLERSLNGLVGQITAGRSRDWDCEKHCARYILKPGLQDAINRLSSTSSRP